MFNQPITDKKKRIFPLSLKKKKFPKKFIHRVYPHQVEYQELRGKKKEKKKENSSPQNR